MSLRKLGLYCGIASPVLWLGLIAVVGALRPDFSHVTHYISELGERGSATEALMRGAAFGFTGFLYLCFAAAVLATIRHGWVVTIGCLLIALEGIGRMGAGVFPCDPGCVRISQTQDLHKLFATIGFCSGILAAILWGILFRRLAPLRPLSSFSIASGIVALVSLLLMSWEGNPLVAPGLPEHLATAVLSIWLFVFAVRLVRVEGTPIIVQHVGVRHARPEHQQGSTSPTRSTGGLERMRPRQLVEAWVDAFNRADADALAAFYEEDAINHQVAESPVHGREAIRQMFASGFASAKMVCVVENIFEDGEWAILEWRDPLGLRGCGFFHIVKGKIALQRGYWDKLSFLRAHGVPLPEGL